tara:strand:+ start:773 stop:1678 length:906 start_codon:yes stop_codon:yes gene_type:complete
MANANWNNPTLDSTYPNFVTEIKNRDEDVATQFTGTSATNIPTNAIQWDSTAKRWKLYGGSSFGELTTVYKLTSLEVTGTTVPANGLYLPSANTPSITSNSNIALQINSSGALGVGASPSFGSSGNLLKSNGSSASPSWTNTSLSVGKFKAFAAICDKKTQGTNGGTFSNGAWRTRDLNHEIDDSDNIVTVSSNRFTLSAGAYLIKWSAPAYDVGNHQTVLYDYTNTNYLAFGSNSSSHTSYSNMTRSFGFDRVSFSGSDRSYEIRHRGNTSKGTTGFGLDTNFGTDDETYTIVEIYQENT